MAKKRGKRKKSKEKFQRQSIRFTKREPVLKYGRHFRRAVPMFNDDYRLWRPDAIPYYDYMEDDSRDSERYSQPAAPAAHKGSRIRQRASERMIREAKRKICRHRKERREQLFKMGKAGKGKRGPKRKKYTIKSNVRC